MGISDVIADRLRGAEKRFFANDNISEFIKEGELLLLEKELTERFNEVIQTLVIDTDNDPNSKATGHRLAKMYLHEIFKGRYYPAPPVTSFPNEKHDPAGPMIVRPTQDKDQPSYCYSGLLVVRAEIKSVCAHHHQAVSGVAYIGVIPGKNVIGLSKYIRIAQHLARRGTLQEQLTEDILRAIQHAAGTDNVAVHINATHGCVCNRGVNASDATTQTTELGGDFYKESELRKEFYDSIAMQRRS